MCMALGIQKCIKILILEDTRTQEEDYWSMLTFLDLWWCWELIPPSTVYSWYLWSSYFYFSGFWLYFHVQFSFLLNLYIEYIFILCHHIFVHPRQSPKFTNPVTVALLSSKLLPPSLLETSSLGQNFCLLSLVAVVSLILATKASAHTSDLGRILK